MSKTQQLKPDTVRLKKRMLDLRINVTDLARRIGRSRPTTALALHHGRPIPTRLLIEEALR